MKKNMKGNCAMIQIKTLLKGASLLPDAHACVTFDAYAKQNLIMLLRFHKMGSQSGEKGE